MIHRLKSLRFATITIAMALMICGCTSLTGKKKKVAKKPKGDPIYFVLNTDAYQLPQGQQGQPRVYRKGTYVEAPRPAISTTQPNYDSNGNLLARTYPLEASSNSSRSSGPYIDESRMGQYQAASYSDDKKPSESSSATPTPTPPKTSEEPPKVQPENSETPGLASKSESPERSDPPAPGPIAPPPAPEPTAVSPSPPTTASVTSAPPSPETQLQIASNAWRSDPTTANFRQVAGLLDTSRPPQSGDVRTYIISLFGTSDPSKSVLFGPNQSLAYPTIDGGTATIRFDDGQQAWPSFEVQ